MTTVDVADDRYILVNIFMTEPAKQGRLIEIWKGLGAAEERAGLVSVNAHLSHDGTSVISYIQWVSKGHWERILTDPGRQERFKEVMTFATFESVHSELVYTQTKAAHGPGPLEISEKDDRYLVFEVARTEPEDQAALLAQVTGFNAALDAAPGYIGHAIHRAFDGGSIVNYTQWEDKASFDAYMATAKAPEGVEIERHEMAIAYVTEAENPV